MNISKSDSAIERAKSQFQKKNFSGAERILRAAAKNDANNAKILHLLGVVLFERRKPKHAETFLKRAVKVEPFPLGAILLLAEIQGDSGRLNESVATLEKANRLFPDNIEVLTRVASKQRAIGQKEAAVAWYISALKIETDNPYLYLEYLVNDGSPLPQHTASAKRIFETAAADPVDRATAGFCLFRIEDQNENHVDAIEILTKSSSLFRSSYKYNSQNETDHLLSVRDHFTDGFIQSVKQQGYTGGNHIFVVGMPRSGTSLIERILASHSAVKGFGELGTIRNLARDNVVDENGALSLERLTERNLKNLGRVYSNNILQGLPEDTVTVDKMPHNFMWVGFIRSILPNAKFVHSKRLRMDTCFSLYKSLFAVGLHKYSYSQNELAEYYLAYTKVMDHWNQLFGDEIFALDYQSLIESPRENMEQLLSHCGLGWEKKCLEFYKTKSEVKTLSSSQVSKPLYASSINSWQKYGIGLEALERALSPQ